MSLARRPLLPLSIVLAACGSPGTQAIAPRLTDLNGVYSYTAYHDDGRLLLTGTITLVAVDDSTLTGSWAIAWAPGADTTAVVGPQVGAGTLVGSLRATTPLLELNPGWADNNVGLLLESGDGDRIAGHWSHTTLIGEIARGRLALAR